MAEILVVEDEKGIREGLAELLECEGYEVRQASDGVEALECYRARRPDLMLLDIVMPKKNGLAVCTEIRAHDKETPILFLTARASEADIVGGFARGADDYMAKTIPSSEKLARIAAVLRRSQRAPQRGDECFSICGCRVNCMTLELERPSGERERLTLREVEMLRCFRVHCGEALSRDYLITRFWGLAFDGNEKTLSVAVSRLREKLGPAGASIRTVVGAGYMFDDRGM